MKNAALASCGRVDTKRYLPGFADVLAIVFIVLKLCKLIDWSWVWVLSPLWISAALTLVLCIVLLILHTIQNKRMERQVKELKESDFEEFLVAMQKEFERINQTTEESEECENE